MKGYYISSDELADHVAVGSIFYTIEGYPGVVMALGQVADQRVALVEIGLPSGNGFDAKLVIDLVPETYEQSMQRMFEHPESVGLWPPFEQAGRVKGG